ncbi:phospholipase A2 [Streptomyces virginiae]|uniref:phospholipase A2 n=1 Tax=Streptomyces virginiae TaxID=1961 RepID=UPI0036A7ABEF
MRRTALPVVAAVSLALLLPQQMASATELPTQPLAQGEIQNIGPGMYVSESNSYQIAENDVPAGLMGRSHTIVAQAQGVSQAQDAPATRSDLGVFGPSWEAEFLGGQLNRKLATGNGAITTTYLDTNESTRYDLTNSVAGPNGGSVNTYKSADGSTIVESITWDDLLGTLKTTAVETLNVNLTTVESGDQAPVDQSGNPIAAADLKTSFTWKQVGGGGDNWRVTAVGSKAFQQSTVAYDSAGRVSTVKEPARGETPAQSLKVNYATATTASGSALGDVNGQVKDITLTVDQTVQTLARYSYDTSGLLRKVTNPAEGSELNAYTYDGSDRVATATSDNGARWELTFSGGSAAPQAQETTGTVPVAGSAMSGAPSIAQGEGITPAASDFKGSEITDPQAYPRYCSTAVSWMWYQYSGCATKVAHYGWKNPYWKQTPTKAWVIGINGDHCTSASDKPGGWDFRAACDSHDYGYGTIGNSYKGYSYYLDRNKGISVDVAFYNILYNNTCPAYFWKGACRSTAYTYYTAVFYFGRPKNGADAT